MKNNRVSYINRTLPLKFLVLATVATLTAMPYPIHAEDAKAEELVKIGSYPSQMLDGAKFPEDKLALLVKNTGISSGDNYHIYNQWDKLKGDHRAGYMLSFSDNGTSTVSTSCLRNSSARSLALIFRVLG